MKFERTGNIKDSIGVGIEAEYKPLHVHKAFKVRYTLESRKESVQSLFGPERGHDVLRVLENEHPNRDDLQRLFCLDIPIIELISIHFKYKIQEGFDKVSLIYDLGYIYEVDYKLKKILEKENIDRTPFRSEEITDLPIIYENNLYFIKVGSVF